MEWSKETVPPQNSENNSESAATHPHPTAHTCSHSVWVKATEARPNHGVDGQIIVLNEKASETVVISDNKTDFLY